MTPIGTKAAAQGAMPPATRSATAASATGSSGVRPTPRQAPQTLAHPVGDAGQAARRHDAHQHQRDAVRQRVALLAAADAEEVLDEAARGQQAGDDRSRDGGDAAEVGQRHQRQREVDVEEPVGQRLGRSGR